MNNFLEAARLKLRFDTKVGMLSQEQLFDIDLDELDALVVDLEDEWEESGGRSYLRKNSKKDKALKLMFKVALEILEYRVELRDAATEAKGTKEHNEKIMAIIADKEDEALKGMSPDELKKLLK
jgi:hypothetical protein